MLYVLLIRALRISLLGSVVILRKAISNFVVSVRPSVGMEKLGSQWVGSY
jgi:hypothetical protein